MPLTPSNSFCFFSPWHFVYDSSVTVKVALFFVIFQNIEEVSNWVFKFHFWHFDRDNSGLQTQLCKTWNGLEHNGLWNGIDYGMDWIGMEFRGPK